MSKLYTINVFTYATDGGDGGGNIQIYNTIEEIKAEIYDDFGEEEDELEEAEEKFQSALSGANHYEDGEIGQAEIQIEIGEDGKAKLASSLYFHYGQ